VLDAATLWKDREATRANKNDIADCTILCEKALAFDIGSRLPSTGRFVLVDGYEISGGGIITELLGDETGSFRSKASVTEEERRRYFGQRALTVSVADHAYGAALERALLEEGRYAYYSAELTPEQAEALRDAGLIVLTIGNGEYASTGDLPSDLNGILGASADQLEI
jgi:bifunctional enzyme CysN/CysC